MQQKAWTIHATRLTNCFPIIRNQLSGHTNLVFLMPMWMRLLMISKNHIRVKTLCNWFPSVAISHCMKSHLPFPLKLSFFNTLTYRNALCHKRRILVTTSSAADWKDIAAAATGDTVDWTPTETVLEQHLWHTWHTMVLLRSPRAWRT